MMNHTNHHPATRTPHHKLRRPARLLAVSLLATAITATAGCGSPEPDSEPLSRTAQGSDRHLEAQADEIAGSVAARVAGPAVPTATSKRWPKLRASPPGSRGPAVPTATSKRWPKLRASPPGSRGPAVLTATSKRWPKPVPQPPTADRCPALTSHQTAARSLRPPSSDAPSIQHSNQHLLGLLAPIPGGSRGELQAQ